MHALRLSTKLVRSVRFQVQKVPSSVSALRSARNYSCASLDTLDVDVANSELSDAAPEDILAWAQSLGSVAMISSFGTQAAVLLRLANEAIPGLPVIMVDTGYLPAETYQYAEQLRELFDLNLNVVSNTEWTPARMEALHGKLWEQGDQQSHSLYGKLRKVEPLKQALKDLDPAPQILLSGVRASQTEARASMPIVSKQPDGIVKINPLLNLSDDDIEFYKWDFDLPPHPLEEKGYATVGDWHSSRPVEEGEDARDTRFGGKFQECGLHV